MEHCRDYMFQDLLPVCHVPVGVLGYLAFTSEALAVAEMALGPVGRI